MEDMFDITKEKVEKLLELKLCDAKLAKHLTDYYQSPDIHIPASVRIKYFRETHPDWVIVTDIEMTQDMGIALSRCKILDDNGKLVATATASRAWTEDRSHVEKAETASKARAIFDLGGIPGTRIATPEDIRYANPEIGSMDDVPVHPSSAMPAKEAVPSAPEKPKEKEITRDLVLERIKFFGVEPDKFNERLVSKHHTFIIRGHDDLKDKARTAFDNLGFKEVKGVYKLRIKQTEEK